MTSTTKKTRVAIIGGGASGMSAAYALACAPDKFAITLFERSDSAGGMATSIPIDEKKFGAEYINDGVQGASPVFYNTYKMFDELGFKASEVGMQVSFGRDPETEFWSNVFPSQVIDKFGPDIKKFGRVLKVIKALEPLFAIISVRAMLRMFMFSKDFGETIVYPLVALFFGTGNQTPYISSAILERVFMDPNMRLFEYSPTSFLASIPSMRAFPRLSLLYSTWAERIAALASDARIRTSTEVTRVQRWKHGVCVWSRATAGTDGRGEVVEPGEEGMEDFDELIMAVDADSALKILGKDARWVERKVLGNVRYLYDLTVTHSDTEYMARRFRLTYDDTLKSKKRDDEESREQYAFAEKNFEPLYFIRQYENEKEKVEMGFDLTAYQPQFKGVPERGPSSSSSSPSPPKEEPPLHSHVFQTIFLDHASSSHLWTKDQIDEKKVIGEKWWKQQSHWWGHYAGTVGFMGLLNGKKHTHYAGAWTVLNMHEIAVVSGFAAAYRLGAPYPFTDDKECKRLFAMCLGVSHGARMRKEDREGFWA